MEDDEDGDLVSSYSAAFNRRKQLSTPRTAPRPSRKDSASIGQDAQETILASSHGHRRPGTADPSSNRLRLLRRHEGGDTPRAQLRFIDRDLGKNAASPGVVEATPRKPRHRLRTPRANSRTPTRDNEHRQASSRRSDGVLAQRIVTLEDALQRHQTNEKKLQDVNRRLQDRLIVFQQQNAENVVIAKQRIAELQLQIQRVQAQRATPSPARPAKSPRSKPVLRNEAEIQYVERLQAARRIFQQNCQLRHTLIPSDFIASPENACAPGPSPLQCNVPKGFNGRRRVPFMPTEYVSVVIFKLGGASRMRSAEIALRSKPNC
ncbi:Hypothetical Protein FCC1311_064642 [Hondaea fermentalgiana]|uniref:Uncharacterized protein n=1 Tax=Hondaea fermentalgiana TaxID=2315210 RepID=A0A2R5GQT7_9STRA|nr:Hypothetical Protein FCC1311_064642 [Hondaea fermentalgiana]|eukprot:GBG30244.1 Hypothetical Protein FCC1311_064642 [Hondaea fermentalgiana]